MDLQAGGGGGGRPRRPRRGFWVPDVRNIKALLKSKVLPRTNQPQGGNPNAIENQVLTEEELRSLFFDYLRSHGVGKEEFETVFGAPKGRDDQGDFVNDLNDQAGGIYYEWAGLRREYYFLMLLGESNPSPDIKTQIKGGMSSIIAAIEGLQDELSPIFSTIRQMHKLPYEIPDVFWTEMKIVRNVKPKKK